MDMGRFMDIITTFVFILLKDDADPVPRLPKHADAHYHEKPSKQK